MTRFSLRHYWFLFKRYWLSLLLAAGLAGAATFFLQNRQPLEYMSQTKVYIGTALASLNTDPKVIVSSIELADIYAEYAKNDVLLSQALDDLELPDRLEDMRWRVSTEVISGHPFLYLRVVYTDPQIAADLANTIVQNMINTVSANQSGDIDAQIDNLQAKIDNLNILINITNSEYQIAYNLLQQVRLEERPSDEQINSLTATLDTLSQQLNESYGALARFTREYVLLNDVSNQLEVVEVAYANPHTVSRNPLFFTAIAAVTALVFAASVIILLDYFDDHIRSEEEVKRKFEALFLGSIPRVLWSHKRYKRFVRTGRLSNTPVAKQYQLIMNGLLAELENRVGELPVFMVTSPIAHTGSSFTANNLAIVASEYGLKTLLIDMNLREPQLHEDFALTNKYGVADLLNMLIDHPELLDDPEQRSLFINWPLQHSAAYPNLSLMCTGTNPDRVVGQLPELDLLRDYFALMVNELDYDLIIMSGASTDNTSDSYNIIAQTQAAPLLVLSSSNTEVDDVWRVLEQFKRRRLEVHGMILNDVF